MATTKLSLSEQVMRMLSSFDRSRAEQIDQREVILLIDQFVNEKAKSEYFTNLKLGKDKSPSTADITTFFNVEVKFDTDTERAYCDLPAAYIQLPDDRGLYAVCSMKDQSDQFIITRPNAMWAYGNSHAGSLQGNKGCYAEGGDKIYFTENILELTPPISKVMIKEFIASSSSISNTAPYPISPEDEKYVITEVFKLLAGVNALPHDKVNDNRKAE